MLCIIRRVVLLIDTHGKDNVERRRPLVVVINNNGTVNF